MNSLSWHIYAADVCSNLTRLLFAAVFFGGATYVILLVVYGGIKYIEEDKDAKPPPKSLLIGVIAVAVIGIAVPSKETIYAIAASEAGERLAKSEAITEVSREALATLKVWLRAQRAEKSK